jgi:hypothetical protein
MATLTGSKIADTYTMLLKATAVVDGTLRKVEDGAGTDTALMVSTAGIAIDTGDELYFDSGNNTYIHEATGDRLDFVIGGDVNGFVLLGGAVTKVGIGTAAPTYSIDVEGAGSQSIRVQSTDNNAQLLLLSTSSGGAETYNSTVKFESGGASGGTIYYDHHATPVSQKMYFVTGDDAINSMVIDGVGNVCIGATAAAEKHASHSVLQIGGNSRLEGVTAKQASSQLNISNNAHYAADASYEYISTDEASLYLQATGKHTFYSAVSGTAGNDITWTGAVRIEDGTVLAGTTSVSHSASVIEARSAASAGCYINIVAPTDGQDSGLMLSNAVDGTYKWTMYNIGSSDTLRIGDAGNDDGVTLAQESDASWVGFSDERMKENITEIDSTIAKLNTLRCAEFNWKEGKDSRKAVRRIGLIAQDVYKVFPRAVVGSPDDTYEYTPAVYNDAGDAEQPAERKGAMQLSYTALVTPIIKAIQELSAKVEALENA